MLASGGYARKALEKRSLRLGMQNHTFQRS